MAGLFANSSGHPWSNRCIDWVMAEAELTSWVMYARRVERGGLRHYYPNKVAVRCAGATDEEIVPVRISLSEEGPLFGWMPKDRDYPSMIYPSMIHVTMCFPYGVEAAVRAGQGRVVRLKAEEIT